MSDISANRIVVTNVIFKYFHGLLWSLLILIAATQIASAADGINAQIIADPSKGEVGDVISLTIQVNHPTGYRIVPTQADSPELWREFEVRSQYPLDTAEDPAGGEISRQIIEVTLWETGIFTTPALPLSMIDTEGNLTEVLATPAIVEIVSVLKEGDTSLRDIKPQATLPTPPLWPWLVAALLLITLLALIGRWLYLRQRDRPVVPEIIIDTRTPHQIALEQFSQIEAQKLPEQQRFKEHYTQVTDVLRTYVEETYNVPALGRTTMEIRQELRSIPDQDGFQPRFFSLLNVADLVKFAKVTPTVENAQEVLEDARQIVLDQLDIADLVQLVQGKPTAGSQPRSLDRDMAEHRGINISQKRILPVLLLCLFFGGLGAHRFYVGKVGTGILQLLTLGGLGIWTLIDLIMIIAGLFKDEHDNKITQWT